MKLIKFVFKFALAFLTFGALASLYLSKNKEEYINISSNNPDLY